ncbi:putative endonuclease containing a URI domain [Vibrio owensii]|nr:GIY-YIG nuclease family protein [Vibrio sp. B1ASS3]CAD7823776.1 endonuclease containing a URI domain [Vibrio sp. B1ASS3]CAE6951479.1 endonuclease containing a URI domain [Vibrio sp. B1ASS3]CAH1527586.1 putative endonuclease containing a URI domain [Vibrio owensii]CAH1567516.1 putative endonuclease containing a URI domain [Vibrio owensii]
MSETAEQNWSVYLIRNNRNALYCGVTNNVERRFKQHESGKGAKALKGKGPLTLEWSCSFENKSVAMKAEYFIKQLTKTKKELLVQKSADIQVGEDQLLAFQTRK